MITQLAHACFIVNDLEASIAFYRDYLGLQPAFEFRRENGDLYGIYLHVGGRSFIELFTGDLAERAPKQSYSHISLEVDDMPATVAELRNSGIAVSDPTLGMDHSWQAWLSDPDGNRIELHQYTPESWQVQALQRLGVIGA